MRPYHKLTIKIKKTKNTFFRPPSAVILFGIALEFRSLRFAEILWQPLIKILSFYSTELMASRKP
jgi:hypothetical protein